MVVQLVLVNQIGYCCAMAFFLHVDNFISDQMSIIDISESEFISNYAPSGKYCNEIFTNSTAWKAVIR